MPAKPAKCPKCGQDLVRRVSADSDQRIYDKWTVCLSCGYDSRGLSPAFSGVDDETAAMHRAQALQNTDCPSPSLPEHASKAVHEYGWHYGSIVCKCGWSALSIGDEGGLDVEKGMNLFAEHKAHPVPTPAIATEQAIKAKDVWVHDFIPCDVCKKSPEHCGWSWCAAPRNHPSHTGYQQPVPIPAIATELVETLRKIAAVGSSKDFPDRPQGVISAVAEDEDSTVIATEGEATGPEYRIEREKHGCPHCTAGDHWLIVNSEDVAESTSYDDEDHAQDICDMLNQAFERGRNLQSPNPHEGERSEPAKPSLAQRINSFWSHDAKMPCGCTANSEYPYYNQEKGHVFCVACGACYRHSSQFAHLADAGGADAK